MAPSQQEYLQNVKKNGFWLQHVPDAMKTEEICFAAVFDNARALKFVPPCNEDARNLSSCRHTRHV